MPAMRRPQLPPDFAWQRGFVSGPATTRWLHCGGKAIAVVAFHNEIWRTTVNRHLDIKRERSAAAPSEDMAVAWVERWAVAHADRIRRELTALGHSPAADGCSASASPMTRAG